MYQYPTVLCSNSWPSSKLSGHGAPSHFHRWTNRQDQEGLSQDGTASSHDHTPCQVFRGQEGQKPHAATVAAKPQTLVCALTTTGEDPQLEKQIRVKTPIPAKQAAATRAVPHPTGSQQTGYWCGDGSNDQNERYLFTKLPTMTPRSFSRVVWLHLV